MTIGDRLKEIVVDMDNAVHQYLERNRILEIECQYENGKLKDSRRASEFEMRRLHVWEEYNKECTELRRRFQNALTLAKEAGQQQKYMPYDITIGKGILQYPGLDERLPLRINFPFEKPLRTADENRSEIVEMMLKILLSLPLGKCEFYVYDPEHYGESIEYFDQLLKVPGVFPSKKVYVAGELSDMLDYIQSYMASLNQERFPIKQCKSWFKYNDLLRQNNEPTKKIIPYKVLVFFGVPNNYEKGDLERILNIAIKNLSISLESDEICEWNLKHLCLSKIKPVKTAAKDFKARQLIAQYKEKLAKDNSGVVTMDELLIEDALFKETAIKEVDIPIGTNAEDGELQHLKLSDEPAHFLVGGATGSGKSNLIHDIILNACWRYSPAEINFILLDYKSGVEFSKYASAENLVLPHAELVAKNADVNYGLTVLQHLCEEWDNRNEKFKTVGKSEYSEYRKVCPNEIFPRIILIIDEFQTIFQDTIDSNALERTMQLLSKKGRSAGIHMIFATQTLKSLSDFAQVATQFTGRIALKCNSEDSNTLLSYDNDAASELVRPYAIMNTQSGRKAYNQKFAVPLVEDGRIEKVMKYLEEKITAKGISHASRKVFDGAKRPVMPNKFAPEGVAFHLGQRTDYAEKEFWLELERSSENNVLFIGERGLFLESIILNAQACEEIDEIDYIGEKLSQLPSRCDKFQDFSDFAMFFGVTDAEDLQSTRRLIIVDGVKFNKRPDTGDKQDKDLWETKAKMLPDLCDKGSHIVAFFATYKEFKRRWADMDMRNIFGIFVGYNIAPQEWQNLTDDPRISNKLAKLERTLSRATYICGDVVTHFRPFRGANDE